MTKFYPDVFFFAVTLLILRVEQNAKHQWKGFNEDYKSPNRRVKNPEKSKQEESARERALCQLTECF